MRHLAHVEVDAHGAVLDAFHEALPFREALHLQLLVHGDLHDVRSHGILGADDYLDILEHIGHRLHEAETV